MAVTKTSTYIDDINRSVFDFHHCSSAQGYAQFDTNQDAPWFGTWVNPSSYRIVCYAEGDVSVTRCDTAQEFVTEMRELHARALKHEFLPARVDPGRAPEMSQRFHDLGLGDLLHDEVVDDPSTAAALVANVDYASAAVRDREQSEPAPARVHDAPVTELAP